MTKNKYYYDIKLDYDTKIIQKSRDVRIYRGVTLITPGVWTDGASMTPTKYTEGALMMAATNWIKNYLNIDHNWSAGAVIGTVQNTRWQNGAVKGDLYINPNLTLGRDVITNIDAGLLNSLSVELMADDYYDTDEQVSYAANIDFIGCAVIYGDTGACVDAKIKS